MKIDLENVRPTRTGHYRLLPNINLSDRELPAHVSAKEIEKNTMVDVEKPSRKISDPEIYSIVVSISDAEWTANPQMYLEATFDVSLFRILNQSASPKWNRNTPPIKINLTDEKAASTKGRGIQFFLEARTFWGSPLVGKDSSPTVSFRILNAAGEELPSQRTWNGNDLRTADIILIGDDAPPERLYLWKHDENQPSVRDVSKAAKAAGVPLTLVPLAVAGWDPWLQDQFQLGYTATPEGEQRIIVHLPRMRDLRNFTDTYFPSKTVGVLKDFWRTPSLKLTDGAESLDLTVAQSFVIFKNLRDLRYLLMEMISLGFEVDKAAAKLALQTDMLDIFSVWVAIDALKRKLEANVMVNTRQSGQVLNIQPILDEHLKFVEWDEKTNTLIVKVTSPIDNKEKKFSFTRGNSLMLKKFFGDAREIHSAGNYGGNIEVSPPLSDARYGKILAGSVTSPKLKEFLTSRGTHHPFAEAYTEWLDVGHIDEIAAFAPLAPSGFCVLRASPKLALDMLRKLVELQKGGILVTRLLRGKKWRDFSEKGKLGAPPPAAYIRFLESDRYDLSAFDRPIRDTSNPGYVDAAFHDDRQFLVRNKMVNRDARYAAMISCADLLAVCTESNRAAEDLFLANTYAYADDISYRDYYDSDWYQNEVFPKRLDKVLQEQFSGIPIYPLPMLFDHVPNYLGTKTSAIVPAVVNFQTLGRHVLVPRPYGPRLPVSAAAEFVTGVIASLRFPRTTIDKQFICSRGLDKTVHWTGPMERVNRAAIGSKPTDLDSDCKMVKRAMTPQGNVSDTANNSALAPSRMLETYIIKNFAPKPPLPKPPLVCEFETLRQIAIYFKDGFEAFKNCPVNYCEGDTEQSHPKADQCDEDLKAVMDKIRDANPDAFDTQGNLKVKDWKPIVIPEKTADVFEVYTTALMEALGLQVHWVDSWYYHTRLGGIHCATNVLRSPR